MPMKKRQPESRSCVWCGTMFDVGGRGRPPLTRRYCSKSCAAQGRVLQPVIPDLRPTVAAYLAAMVDGEGSIIASPRKGTTRIMLRVIVVNTDAGLMDWLVANVGGSANRRTNIRSAFTSTPKPVWTWVVNGANAVRVLEQIEPFLVIKADKARRGIESQPRKP